MSCPELSQVCNTSRPCGNTAYTVESDTPMPFGGLVTSNSAHWYVLWKSRLVAINLDSHEFDFPPFSRLKSVYSECSTFSKKNLQFSP